MTEQRSFRIGIVGAGEVAERHIQGFLAAGGVTLVTVTDPFSTRRNALAQKFDFERVDETTEAVIKAPDLDIVVILTPHYLHAQQSIQALEAGKHVICEKPMACTVAECDAMLEVSQRCQRQVFVTHRLRNEFFFYTALERLPTLGQLTLGSFRWYTDELGRLQDPHHWKGTLRYSGGGVLIDGGCHVADLANKLFGKAQSVQAMSSQLVATRAEVGEDTATVMVQYASGALCSFAISFIGGQGMRPQRFAFGVEMDLYGTEGYIRGGFRIRDSDFQRYCLEHHPGEPDRVHVYRGQDAMGDIDTRIIKSLHQKLPPPITAVESRNAIAVIEAAYRSLKTQRVEPVDWHD